LFRSVLGGFFAQAHVIHILRDVLHDAGGGYLHGLPHRVFDGVGIGGAVCLDHRLGNTQDQRAAYLTVVHLLLNILTLLAEEGSDHGEDVLLKHSLDERCHIQSCSLDRLEEHIAGEAGESWYDNDGLYVYICHSKWMGEGQWRKYKPTDLGLCPGSIHGAEKASYRVNSIGSWSTGEFYPMVIVEDKKHGRVWYTEIEGSHNWLIELDAYGGYNNPSFSVWASGCDEENGGWYYDLKPGETVKIPTGIRARIDDGWVLKIYPRSGLGFKFRLQLDNTIGVIDADYYNSDNEGHIWIKITNDSKEDKTLTIKGGEAFAQGIIMQYFKTEDDNADGIRNGGFGSTSK